MGLYSNKHKKLADLPSGAKVVLNSDPANTARGLKLLETAKLITLDPKVDLPTDTDVTSNPKNLSSPWWRAPRPLVTSTTPTWWC